MSISKKVRFEVFKRDGFTCRYCGMTPPDAILEVDHLIAIANGGKDDMANLLTSCFACNRGKSKIPLETLPSSVGENLAVLKEQRKQMKAYYKELEEANAEREQIIRELGHYFFNMFPNNEKNAHVFGANGKNGLKMFLKYLNKFKIQEAFDIAYERVGRKHYNPRETDVFRYSCAILHSWVREKLHVD